MAISLLIRIKINFKSTTFGPLQENGKYAPFPNESLNTLKALITKTVYMHLKAEETSFPLV